MLCRSQDYAAKHDNLDNTTKTECMVVLQAHYKMDYFESVQLSVRALTFVDRLSYLSHVLHHDMTDEADHQAYSHGWYLAEEVFLL